LKLSGIITAAITPMSPNGGELADKSKFEQYYHFLLERKVNGIFVCGTTGEGMLLPLSERKQIAERAVAIVSGEIPVLVHVGCNSTNESIELARHAQSIHADAVGVITPYFYSYDPIAMASHFKAVANAVPDLPVFLYYLPSMAHNDIPPQLVAEICSACSNVVGIKHSDSDQVRLQEYRQAGGKDFILLSGDDSVALAALALGADGCVTGKSSAFPEMMVAIYQAFQSADFARARLLQSNLNRLLGGLLDIGEGIGLAYFKAALRYRGLDVGGMRLPQRWLTDEEEANLVGGLQQLNEFCDPPGSWVLPNPIEI
jgi:dihydrodipicolinate synthase/N-acetylneuraminate lyase